MAARAQEATSVVVAAPRPMTLAPGKGLQKVRAELTLPTLRRGLALWPELGQTREIARGIAGFARWRAGTASCG